MYYPSHHRVVVSFVLICFFCFFTFSPSMARLVTVIDTFCQLSEGLKRLRVVCEAMPTQQAWGNRSSSGTTTWPGGGSRTGRNYTGQGCHIEKINIQELESLKVKKIIKKKRSLYNAKLLLFLRVSQRIGQCNILANDGKQLPCRKRYALRVGLMISIMIRDQLTPWKHGAITITITVS